MLQGKFSIQLEQAKKMVKKLLQSGADINIQSTQGLYPIHAAAQGDHPLIIKWFLDQNIDINIKDTRNCTALHWAVFSNSEQAVNYLISWKIDLNVQDSELGYTALHLAAIRGQTRVVRKLLVRGADRTIRDFKGKTPLDIAILKNFPNMQKMLIDKIGVQEFCNIRQPFRPLNRNYRSVVAFMMMFIFGNSIPITIYIIHQDHIGQLIFQLVLILIIAILYILLVISDPGHLNDRVQLLVIQNYTKEDALSKYQAQLICPDCQIIKPIRSKHCEICQKCCIVYDHHCPWINNCVGAKQPLQILRKLWFVFYFRFFYEH